MDWRAAWAHDSLSKGTGWGPCCALLVEWLCQTCARCDGACINEVFVVKFCPGLFELFRLLGAWRRVVARICIAAVGCNRLRNAQLDHTCCARPSPAEGEWHASGECQLNNADDGGGVGGFGCGCSGLRGLLRSIDVSRRPRLLLLCLLLSC